MKANIYVSATYRDLKDHRRAACDAIRALGHVDVAMEHYGAESKRPLVRCLKDVQGCDLYIGIIARRYGYVPEGADRSITEQEFRTAVKHGKDILCFTLADDADWPDDFTDTGEPGRRLQAWRDELAARYLLTSFTTPDSLAAKVTRAIASGLSLEETPFDAERENRLMSTWRRGAKRSERTRARHALLNMGSPRYAAAIKELLLDARRRCSGAGSNTALAIEEVASYLEELLLLSVNSRQAMPVLLDLFHSEDVEVQYFAVFNVGELGLRGKEIDPEIVRHLIRLESQDSAGVRSELAHTLGKIHHADTVLPEVKASLERLATDPDEGVRERATESLDALET